MATTTAEALERLQKRASQHKSWSGTRRRERKATADRRLAALERRLES